MGQYYTKIETPHEIASSDDFSIGKRFNTPSGVVVVVDRNPDCVYVYGNRQVYFRRIGKFGGGSACGVCKNGGSACGVCKNGGCRCVTGGCRCVSGGAKAPPRSHQNKDDKSRKEHTKAPAVTASEIIESDHSSSKWSRTSNRKNRVSADGSPPDNFVSENIGIG